MQAAGNPLIALEALRGFLEEEGLSRAPTDPNAVLQARIDGATRGPGGGELRSALARATLLGRSFTLRPLMRLCAVPGDPEAPELASDREFVESLLERAVSAGLAVEQGPGRWRFGHDLVRNQFKNVCRQLANWPALNLAAAELKLARALNDQTGIELEVVARHQAEAGKFEAALELGQQSLRRLHGAGLMGHATSFGRRLLEWDDRRKLLTPAEAAEIHLLASDAAEHAGQPDEAELQARHALELAKRNELSGHGSRAASRLGLLALHDDDPEQAESWLWDALRFARKSGDPRARCLAHLTLGQLYQHLDKLDQALVAFEASLESARAEGLTGDALAARSAIAQLDRLEGRVERAEEAFEKIAEEAAAAGLEVAAIIARHQIGLCAWSRGDAPAALAAFQQAREDARGNLFAVEFYACLGEAWALATEGRWGEVEVRVVQAEDLRYDVRLHDAEAERLRRGLRELALTSRRIDLVERVDKLDVLVTRTHTTTAAHTRSN
jgi:tetratricopeptide (TPR) repeat protein